MNRYTIKELSQRYQITARTIRFYEEKNLLHIQHDAKGHRIYTDDDCLCLQIILFYKEMGLELSEIEEMLGKEQLNQSLHAILLKQKADIETKLNLNDRQLKLLEKLRANIVDEKDIDISAISLDENDNKLFFTRTLKQQMQKMSSARFMILVYGMMSCILGILMIFFVLKLIGEFFQL